MVPVSKEASTVRCGLCGRRKGITGVYAQQGGGNYCKKCYPIVTQELILDVSRLSRLTEFNRMPGMTMIVKEVATFTTVINGYVGDLSFCDYGIFYVSPAGPAFRFTGTGFKDPVVRRRAERLSWRARSLPLHQQLAEAKRCVIIPRGLITSIRVAPRTPTGRLLDLPGMAVHVDAGSARYEFGDWPKKWEGETVIEAVIEDYLAGTGQTP